MELQETMGAIAAGCRGEDASIGTVVDALGRSGIGVMLFLPALVGVLPVSLVPGVAAVCALVALFASLHLFFGREELWLPERIRDISLCETRTARVLDRMSRVARRMDRVSRPRLQFLSEGPAQKASALAAALLSLATLVFGFLPFVDTLLMTPVIFFGLGASTGDGIMTGVGWLCLGVSLAIASFLF